LSPCSSPPRSSSFHHPLPESLFIFSPPFSFPGAVVFGVFALMFFHFVPLFPIEFSIPPPLLPYVPFLFFPFALFPGLSPPRGTFNFCQPGPRFSFPLAPLPPTAVLEAKPEYLLAIFSAALCPQLFLFFSVFFPAPAFVPHFFLVPWVVLNSCVAAFAEL